MTPPKEKEPKRPKAKSSPATKPVKKKRAVTFDAVAAEPAEPVEINGAAADDISAHSENFPGYETVRIRAYELYLARGGEHGHDLEDWLTAENEFKNSR